MLIYKLYNFTIYSFFSYLANLIFMEMCSIKIFPLAAVHITWKYFIIANIIIFRASTVLRLEYYSWNSLIETSRCTMCWRREEQSIFEILLRESHQSEISVSLSISIFLVFPKPFVYNCFLETILWKKNKLVLFFLSMLDPFVILTLKSAVSLLN